jgi:lysophospholipase L1-like esterase
MKKLIALALLLGCGVVQAAQFSKTIIMGDSLSSGGPDDWVFYAPSWYFSVDRNKSIGGRSMGDWTSQGAPDAGVAALADGWLTDHPEADSVILFVGVNDINSYNRGNGIQLFNNLQASINVIKTYPNIKEIVVVTPAPFGKDPGMFGYERAQEYMALAEPYCEADPLLYCFDAWNFMEDPDRPGFQKPGYTDGADQTHTIVAGAQALEEGMTAFIEANVIAASVTLPIDIDVDPWNTNNKVYPNSDYAISAAVLGSNEFDVMQINPATVKLGFATTYTPNPWLNDFDNDIGGHIDAVFGFKTEDTGIACNDTEVTLTGETYSGEPFERTDTIDATDCIELTCHPL